MRKGYAAAAGIGEKRLRAVPSPRPPRPTIRMVTLSKPDFEQAVARLRGGIAGGGLDHEQRVGGDAGDRCDVAHAVAAAEQAAIDDEMRIGVRERVEGPHDAGRGEQRTAA